MKEEKNGNNGNAFSETMEELQDRLDDFQSALKQRASPTGASATSPKRRSSGPSGR